ncbi:hypothetical protein LCGC14_2288910 [marine sediment metagenome]|uniref:Uncharacterized protein n=1 Tax=marine sediment metagenome TaxID=412755 RepID=A0A0F9CRP0_9ZZZZ
MSELDELRKERRGLQSRVAELLGEVGEIDQKLKPLEREESRAEHPCSCVRLNSDIGVNDMGVAEAMRRRTFGIGLVAELLSADRDCLECAGTGVPKEEA